jgi:nitrite reductase/ring-hydroxylating ferredoxin subunit
MPSPVKIATYSQLVDGKPHAARVGEIDLVVVRVGDAVHVLYGRCPHRGAPMADGCLEGDKLVCKAHGWDFRLDTGASDGVDDERLQPFTAHVDPAADAVHVDEDEIRAWEKSHPQAFHHSEFLGG